jgi:hypothetical protein
MPSQRILSLGLLALALGALTAVLVMSGGRADTAGTFNPTSAYSVSDPTPGAHSNIVSEFHVPEGDYQFGTLINFIPPEWGIAPGIGVPDGAIVAGFSSIVSMGLIGGGCMYNLGAEFDMLDATLDMGTTIPFEDPEVAAGDPGGNTPGDLDDQFDDDGPSGLPLGVALYPDYLTRIFKDPGDNTLTPLVRAYGQTSVAGIYVSLNFMMFNPGTAFKAPHGDIIATNPMMGYPSFLVVQATGDPGTEPTTEDSNAISDFCSSLDIETTMFAVSQDNADTAADESGVVLLANPGAGTYNSVAYAVSQRDADGDGHENGLDPCPLTADPTWDPRAFVPVDTMPGDADADGLPDSCDPFPDVKSGASGGVYDEDGDKYGNRSDNCPLVANSAGQLGGSGPDNQADGDSDGIGDQCDPNPDDPDTEGVQIKVCITSPVDIGGGGPPPVPAPQDMSPCDPNADADGDGYPDGDEALMGTDPLAACPVTPAAHDEEPDAWPPDFDDNQWLNILDISQITPPVFDARTGDPLYSRRKDLDGNGWINILDISQMTPPAFDSRCTP